ncbi:MAG TPA: ATP-dependent helicase, partial [Candidatus Saccharimonadales bacterium]|nr:ATP-dependent helicase [Candidatus Saccharimonadales bacterium]
MNTLNQEQQAALDALQSGNVAVLAGPGSGKTHTLVAAVQTILERQPTARVACLTFTNKTAEQLRSRLSTQPRRSSRSFIGTFHSLATRVLKESGAELPPIASEQEVAAVLAGLTTAKRLRGSAAETNARELVLLISRYKNGSLDTPDAARLTAAYDAALAERGIIDYDDLILRCIEHIRAGELPIYDYLLVDEFQDTSPRQYELLQALDKRAQTRFFIIGDPRQSIYRFRGADGSVLQRFSADWRPQLIVLSHNYRSAQGIVAAANRVFADDEQTQQHSIRQTPGTVRLIETLDEYGEADYVLRAIEHALGGTEWHRTHHEQQWLDADRFADFAVLYRTRRQGELLAKKLRAAGLPVQRLGEDSPYA